MDISAIGLDLAKSVYQVHAVDTAHQVVMRKRLKRGQVLAFFSGLPACLVGMEACATAHHWARELRALGHDVRLIPPQYAKAYVKRNKTDPADAAAICEAVTRPSMSFVPIKSREQQAELSVHGVRRLLMGQRTALINALRSHLAEFGLIAASGGQNLKKVIALIDHPNLPAPLPLMLRQLVARIDDLSQAIDACNGQMMRQYRDNSRSRRLATQPGFGVVLSTAVAATVTDPNNFKSGRQFAAWLGLLPKQDSSGDTIRLGRISKKGNEYLRQLFVSGAMSVILAAKRRPDKADPWLLNLLARNKPTLVVAVALANKMARIAWAIMVHDTDYQPGHRSQPPMAVAA
jgi:transposase